MTVVLCMPQVRSPAPNPSNDAALDHGPVSYRAEIGLYLLSESCKTIVFHISARGLTAACPPPGCLNIQGAQQQLPMVASCSTQRHPLAHIDIRIADSMVTTAQATPADAGHRAIPPLPSEIIVAILDYFRRDKPTLKACSLVSKSWILVARFHLFRVLTVRCGPYLDGVVAFLEYLCTPWGSNVCAYVRELRIKGPAAFGITAQREPILELEILGAVLDKLTRLDTVELMALAWRGVDPNTTTMPLTSPSVKTLILTSIMTPLFGTLDDIFDILHLVPNAKTFRANRVEWRSMTLSHEPRKSFPPDLRLESIEFKATGLTQQVVDLSKRRFNLQSLEKLAVWQLHAEDVQVLGRFFHFVGPLLRQLHIKLSETWFIDEPEYPSPEDVWPLMNLSACTALESFLIFVPMDNDPDMPGPAIDYVPYWESVEIMFEALPDSIRDIRFGMEVLDKSFLKELLREVQWDVLEGVFARLTKLKSISFYREDRHEEYFVTELPTSVQKLIKQRMATSARKELLHFALPPRI